MRRLARPPAVIATATLIAVAVIAVLLSAGGGAQPRRHVRVAVPAAGHAASRPTRVGTPTQGRRFTIGYSVRGRRITAFELGARASTRSILVVGCIHGNEQAGIAVARRLLGSGPPPGIALWVVPVLNPDGVAADTRQNADGVDLNRNFPWRWQELGSRGYLQYSGPGPLSEPESRAARRLILRVQPRITIWFHQPLDLVDISGGDPRIERAFAHLVGLRLLQLPRYPGSAVSWGNAVISGSTSFVVELPPGSLSADQVDRYASAVLSLTRSATPRPA